MVKLLDFTAPWCIPCRMMTPIIEKITEIYKDKIEVVKIDVDKQDDVALSYNITQVPTFILTDGKNERRLFGMKSQYDLEKAINDFLKDIKE